MNNIKRIAILLLVLALGALLFQNRAPVHTRFLMVTVEMPLILLLVLAAAGGFCLGLLVTLIGRSKAKAKP